MDDNDFFADPEEAESDDKSNFVPSTATDIEEKFVDNIATSASSTSTKEETPAGM